MQQPARDLEKRLATAATKVWANDVWIATRQGIDQATWVIGGTAVAAAATLFVARFLAAPTASAVWVGGLGLLVSTVVVGANLVTAWFRRPSPSNVAERLDFVATDHNFIATALDLARTGDRSPFAFRAVTAGVEQSRLAAGMKPVLRAKPAWNRRGWAFVAVGGALMTLTFIFPLRPRARIVVAGVDDASGRADATTPILANFRRLFMPPSVRISADTQQTGSATPLSTPASSGRQESAQADAGPSSASTAHSWGDSSVIANTTGGAPRPKTQSVGQSTDQSVQSPKPSQRADETSEPAQLTSFGNAAADRTKSNNSPNGGSGGSSDDIDAPASRSHEASGVDAQGQTQGSFKVKPSGSGGADSDQSGPSKSSSRSKGHGMSSSDALGGRGQGSGENAPKKARGVAPLLLATPEPDLFEGRQLPGPDERSRLQVPPRPTPGEPSPAAAAAVRADDEPAVPVYCVPADSRLTVDQYFERFHQDNSVLSAVDQTH